MKCSITAVPNLFGTRDQFRGRQFFHGQWRGWGGVGSGGNASDGEQWGTADKASLAGPPATPLLLYGPVPNRQRTAAGPQPRGWGPLLYKTLSCPQM